MNGGRSCFRVAPRYLAVLPQRPSLWCLAQRHLEPSTFRTAGRPRGRSQVTYRSADAALSPPSSVLAAAPVGAMRLRCRTGEHSHALQVLRRRPWGTRTYTHKHTRVQTHTYTPNSWHLEKEKKSSDKQQLLTGNNSLNKDELSTRVIFIKCTTRCVFVLLRQVRHHSGGTR